MTKTIPCNCKHKTQDEMYGKSQRVCNKTSRPEEYRCTVCGSIHKRKD